MPGLNGCYSWEAVFSPQVQCPTSNTNQTTCPDATWFWVAAAAIAAYALVKKSK